MKKAAIIIDRWKLPIFKKHLGAAGYSYIEQRALIKDLLTLTIKFEWIADLKPIIDAAEAECQANKK